VGDKMADSFFAWLKQKPFLEQRGKGWIYHEIVRSQMLRYKLYESPQSWATLHGKLADYFEQLYNRSYSNNDIGQIDTSLKSYQLEAFYHRVCQSTSREILPIITKFMIANMEDPKKDNSFAEMNKILQQAMNDLDIENPSKFWNELNEELESIANKFYQLRDLIDDYIKKYSGIESAPEKIILTKEFISSLHHKETTIQTMETLGFDIMLMRQKIEKLTEIINNFENKTEGEQATVIDTDGQKARKRKLPSRSKNQPRQTE